MNYKTIFKTSILILVILSVAKNLSAQSDGSGCNISITLPAAATTCSQQPLRDFTMNGKEMWFKFFSGGGDLTIAVARPSSPPEAQVRKLSLFDGECPNLVLVKEVSSSGTDMPSMKVSKLKPGKYFLKTERIIGEMAVAPANFQMCLTKGTAGGGAGYKCTNGSCVYVASGATYADLIGCQASGCELSGGGKPSWNCSNSPATNSWKQGGSGVILCPDQTVTMGAPGGIYAGSGSDKLNIKNDGTHYGITLSSEDTWGYGQLSMWSFENYQTIFSTHSLDISSGGDLNLLGNVLVNGSPLSAAFSGEYFLNNQKLNFRPAGDAFHTAQYIATQGITFIDNEGITFKLGNPADKTIFFTPAGGIKVCATGCDFVFEKKHELPSLQWRKEFTEKNKHLPNVKSAKEIEKEGGVELGETSTSILQNVEEHELYLYQHDERLEKLEKENVLLKKELADIKKQLGKKK